MPDSHSTPRGPVPGAPLGAPGGTTPPRGPSADEERPRVTAGGPQPPPPQPSQVALEAYARALEVGAQREMGHLRREHPALAGEFDAIDSAWNRLSPLLGHPTLLPPARHASVRAGSDDVDPGISLDRRPGSAPADEGPNAGPLLDRIASRSVPPERYRARREIARGGMGSIQSVWDDDLRRHLVMKVMMRPQDRDPEAVSRPPDSRQVSRFLEEAQITSQLDHPSIVPVHDIGIDEHSRLYFTMPLVQGEDLGKVIRKAREAEDGWTRTRVLGSLVKVMEAVAFAHSRGVIHRDLKPENIMVGRFGQTYVMDWGLARVLDEAERTDRSRGRSTLDVIRERVKRGAEKKLRPLIHTERSKPGTTRASSVDTLDGDVVGTPGYMAPEQARGQRDRIGPGADIYAIGAILYQLLTGHRPFDDPISRESGSPLFERILESVPVPIEQLEKDCPTELVAIARMAMATDPADRYESMLAMIEDLRAYLEGHVVRAYEAGLLAEVRKWIVRNRVLASTIGAAAATVIGLTAFTVWQQQQNLEDLTEEQARTEQAVQEADAERLTANRERDRAELARQEAERASQDERRASAVAQEQRDRANELSLLANDRADELEQINAQLLERDRIQRRQRYMANIRAADIALSANDVPETRRVLEACEPDLRGWEWHYLKQRVDLSVTVLDTSTRAPIAVASITPDLVAELAADDSLRLWRFGNERPVRRWRLDATPVDMAVDRATGTVAISYGPGALSVLRLDQDDVTRRLIDPTDVLLEFGPLAFDPTGRRLAAGISSSEIRSRERSVTVFDVASGRPRAALGGRRARDLTALAWSPDGAWIAVGYDDGALQLFDGASYELVDELTPHREPITAIAFSSDGSRLVCTSLDQMGTVLDVEARSPLAFLRNGADALTRATFGGDDRWIATAAEGRTLQVWDARSGALRTTLNGHDQPIRDLDLDPDTGRLVTVAGDGTVRVWDPLASEPSTAIAAPNVRASGRLDFSPDGERLLIPERFAAAAIDLRTLERASSTGTSAVVSGRMHHSVDGAYLIAPSTNSLLAWDPETGAVAGYVGTIPRAWGRRWVDLALADDGSVAVASGPGDGSAERWPDRHVVGLWRFPDRDLRPERDPDLGADHLDADRIAVLPAGVEAVDLLPIRGGRQVLVAGDDGRIRLYRDDGSAGDRLILEATLVTDSSLAWEATSRTLHNITAFMQGLSGTGLLRRRPLINPPLLLCMDLDPRAGVLAVGREDSAIDLWSLAERVHVGTLLGHENEITAVDFAPDGTRLLTASADRSLRIWDPELRESLITLRDHEGHISDARFAPDGSSLASVDDLNTLRLWETNPPAERLDPRREAADLRRDARRYLLSMLDSFVGTTELMERVSDDDSLTEPLREKIRTFVRLNGENAARLASDAWAVVQRGDAPLADYEAALAWARFACALEPDQPIFLRTLGAAQFRNGQTEACIETLERAGDLHRVGPRVEELAILAMAYADSGQDERSRLAHMEFDSRSSESIWQKNEVVMGLSREVRDRLGAAPISLMPESQQD